MPLQVSAVLLAAGSARRMGSLKQLLPLNDRPVIRHCLDSILSAGIEDVITVLRPGNEDMLKAVEGFTKKVAFNETPETGMSGSVSAGLQMIAPASTGVLICLSDLPLVRADTHKTLTDLHMETPCHILVPLYLGKKGHPALFPVDKAMEVFSGLTLYEIIRKNERQVRYMPVSDEGVVLDMDTREDYSMIRTKMRRA